VNSKHLVPNTSSTIPHHSFDHHPSPFPNYPIISSALQTNQKTGSSKMSLLKLSWALLVFASSNHQLRNNKNTTNNRMVVDAFAHPIIIHQSSATAIISVQKQPQDHRALFQQHRPHQLPSKQQLIAWIQDTITVPPVLASETLPTSDQPLPPTKEQIALLRQAFAAFYGTARDYALAEQLLTQAVDAWQKQPPDEQAGLYRVRGDCQMALLQPSKAIEDYTKALELLQRSKSTADPSELPAV
jgi:tetratricopeptide (TPR) repeat protein